MIQSEKRKTDDRSGAHLLLGDTGDPSVGREMASRRIHVNPPRVLRDPDAGVRIKICEGLGNLKAKTKSACEGLLKGMARAARDEVVVRLHPVGERLPRSISGSPRVAISQSSTPMTRVGSSGSSTTLSKRKSLWITQLRDVVGLVRVEPAHAPARSSARSRCAPSS